MSEPITVPIFNLTPQERSALLRKGAQEVVNQNPFVPNLPVGKFLFTTHEAMLEVYQELPR